MSSDFVELTTIFKTLVLSFHQGRPIGFSTVMLSSFIGGHIGGLPLIYIFEFFINLLNVFIFYHFLKKLNENPIFIYSGVLAFTLFPADVTKGYLTHIHVLPSISFLLLAFLAYFNERSMIAYSSLLASLLCYETPYFLFFVAPIMHPRPVKRVTKRIFQNTSVMTIIFALYVLVRRLYGDSRAADMSLKLAVYKSFSNMLKGPLVALSSFVSRPYQFIISNDKSLLIPSILVFIVVIVFLKFIHIKAKSFFDFTVTSGPADGHIRPPIYNLIRLMLLGTILLILSYPLTLTVDAAELAGRASRVHTSAIIGASIMFASVSLYLFTMYAAQKKQGIYIFALSLYIFTLSGSHLLVQSRNVTTWSQTREFWSDVIQLAPDLADNTIILVDSSSLKPGEELYSFTWELPLVLDQVLVFPKNWENEPMVYRLNSNWTTQILDSIDVKSQTMRLGDSSSYVWPYYVYEKSRIVSLDNVILLEEDANNLRRVEEVTLNNVKLNFKVRPNKSCLKFPHKNLYRYLISEEAKFL